MKKKGPQGSAGTDGRDGIDGTDGDDGNENVHSFVVDINMSNAQYSGAKRFYEQPCSIVTSDIFNNGAVLVYVYMSTNSWEALPYETTYTSYSRIWRFEHYTGYVRLWLYNSDGSYPTTDTYSFKIVCIASARLAANPNVNLNNYEEVKKAFNLKD